MTDEPQTPNPRVETNASGHLIRLGRDFDHAQHDKNHRNRNPDDYQRGLEAMREMTFDDDVDGDTYEEHCEFESRRSGLFVRTNRELF